MAKLETITAIDIGTSKVVCAIAETSREGDLRIVSFGTSPDTGMRKGTLVDSNAAVRSVESAISMAEKQGFQVGNLAVVGLSSEYLMSKLGHGVAPISGVNGQSTEQDVNKAVRAASLVGVPSDTEVVSTVPRCFMVDGQKVTKPLGICGTRLEAEVLLTAASSSYLQNIRKVVTGSGADIVPNAGMIPAARASALAVLNDNEKSLGVCMADIGHGTLDFAVYTEGEIGYASVLPQGGSVLATDVACYFKIPLEEAEKLLRKEGVAAPQYLEPGAGDVKFCAPSISGDEEVVFTRKQLSEVIEARLLDIFDWMKKEIETARKDYGLTITELVLTGGTSLLPGLAKMADRELDLKTRVASPCYPVDLPQAMSSPIYSTVVGLLLYAATLPSIEDTSGGANDENEDGMVSSFYHRVIDWCNRYL